MLGGQSILFQQQDFLEKQAGGDDGKLQQCFTTLMQNWVTSYQKSRLRARMACRPLFGEGMQKEEMKGMCVVGKSNKTIYIEYTDSMKP